MTGEEFGIQPVKVWFGQAAPMFRKVLPFLLVKTLATTPASFYEQLSKDIGRIGSSIGFTADPRLYHDPDGATCFLSSTDGSKHGTLVFDRGDIATMYANQIARRKNDEDIKHAIEQPYATKDWKEEFRYKVCVLGFGVFFDKYHRFPYNYFYDEGGLRIFFGDQKSIGWRRDNRGWGASYLSVPGYGWTAMKVNGVVGRNCPLGNQVAVHV